MPSKSKRVASRQAKLSAKKRKGKAAPQLFETGPTARAIDEDEESSGEMAHPRRSTQMPSLSTSEGRLLTASRSQSDSGTLTQPYLTTELKNIAIIAGLVFAAIIALSFVLGN